MNCPSRTDELPEHPDWNQNPPYLAADQTTRQDLNGIANLRTQRWASLSNDSDPHQLESFSDIIAGGPPSSPPEANAKPVRDDNNSKSSKEKSPSHGTDISSQKPTFLGRLTGTVKRLALVIVKFAKFIGPGFLVAVAYIDPGNYSTDVAAGAATKFGLLFIVLMSNVFAILLQSLAIRLGTVTGMNLAQSCREHLPKWLNIFLYCLGEAAIIATDIAEVSDFLFPFYLSLSDITIRSLALRLRSIYFSRSLLLEAAP